ncbi:glucan endo-1,3-beta-glucosidase [Trifolium repens]|nr:glucan endo-1,3-beta-glucosidase [Trifolium repens]
MATPMLKILIAILLATLSFQVSGQYKEWCITDEQFPEDVLQRAMDYACNVGGVDCSKVQVNQPCFLPNTVKDHASYVFNDYYQKYKHIGGSCYFNSAAIISDSDPSK